MSAHRKPDPVLCPGRYCFHWLEALDGYAPGLHADLSEAAEAAEPVPASRCGCTFGLCTRLSPAAGTRDWYEPNECALLADGLPWFYFVASPDGLVEEAKEAYIRDSQDLWGERHWER